MPKYSSKRIQDLLYESDNALTADAKGDKLEELIRYLFEEILGIEFLEKNVLDGNRAHELDLVFWNSTSESKLGFLELILIIECKNTATAISSAAVGWFVRKLQDRGSKYGILVSLSGITGFGDGISNAHSEVISALIRDGIKILIISRDEILTLKDTNDLVDLLKQKLLKLVLYKTIM